MASVVVSSVRLCLFGDTTSVHFVRWVKAIHRIGYRVSVISTKKAKIEELPTYTIDFTELVDNPNSTRIQRLHNFCHLALLLRRYLRAIRPHITHVHYLRNDPSVFAFFGVKNLILSPWGNDIIYDYGKEPLRNKIFKKFALRSAKRITSSSKFLASRIAHYRSTEPHIVYFGIDTDFFSGAKLNHGNRITISFIKHLEEKYGAKYLIEAVPIIAKSRRNFEVLIVGQGSQETFLKQRVHELQMEKYIKFLGKVKQDGVREILSKSDIFVMPSVYESESFGVAAAEALAMRVPVIASNIGGVPEIVRNHETGLLVAARNHKAIAEACLFLMKNRHIRTTMGIAGRNLIVDEYSWQDSIKTMSAIYLSMVNVNEGQKFS